jgi:hypothetical protein
MRHIQWVPQTFSPGVKQQGRGADHSTPSSAKVKNGGATPLLPHIPSWRGAQLINLAQGQLYILCLNTIINNLS